MSDKPHLQFHQTLPELSDKSHLIFFQTLPELSDKPHLIFFQTLPELSDKVHLPFLQTLSELPDKVHLSFFQTPHELPDKVHLPFFQTLPESRSVQNNLAFYPPSLHRIQTKKQSAFRRRKWKKIPYPITMKLFYEQECRFQILPHAIFCTFISYSPLFCTAFLFSSNVPTLYALTLSSFRPSAVFHFFVAASHLTFHLPPQPDSFVCFHAFLL